MSGDNTEPVVTGEDENAFFEFSGQYYQTGEKFDEALKKAFAAHRTAAVAKREAEIVGIIRDLHTHANESIDPKDLLRMIELIQNGGA